MTQTLGWTLIHSLWQGALAALALATVIAATRSARVRYAAACGAMLAMLAGFGATFVWLMPGPLVETVPPAAGRLVQPSGSGLHAIESPDASPQLPSWLTPLWMAGVMLFYLRSLVSWLATRRLLRTGVCAPAPLWQDRIRQLSARLGLRRTVRLLESCRVEMPVLIGALRPVILTPVGMLTGLPAGQIEAILLHELAHVRRYDYLVNVLQSLVEGLLFYHPAVWWISRIVRAERENCCDDLVVATSGDAREYAAALTAIEQNRAAREPALAATGGSLVKRIRRLLHLPPESPRTAWAPVFSAAILTVTAAVAMLAWPSPAPAPQPQAASPDPFTRWLDEEVVYIITAEEREAFQRLESDPEREHFIEQFWLRRDPTPGTPANEYKEEHYRRIDFASERFAESGVPGWRTDRGQVYIIFGPPDEIRADTRNAVRPPTQQWLYRWIEGVGNNVQIDFTDPSDTGHLTMDTALRERLLAPHEWLLLRGVQR